MRFLTALVALGQGAYRLTGTERLCQRPLGELLQALAQLGVQVASERGDGCPPVTVQGGLRGGRARLSGAVSSQYVSALLFIGPLAPAGVEIEITDELVSRPYVDLTLEVMEDFGISYYREGYRYFQVPGGQDYQPADYAIEADASSASYFWAAAAITGGRVTIANLSWDSCQGDAAFPGVLEQMGCTLESDADGLTVQGGPLQGITVDMAAMPDLVPTLAVVAAFAQGETVITGVAHLRHKESDRLAAVATELGKDGDRRPGNRRRPDHPGRRAPRRGHRHLPGPPPRHELRGGRPEGPGGKHQRPRLRGQVLSGFLGVFREVVSRRPVAADFTVKIKIPLNPPLLKGDFKTPPLKKGGRGDFHSLRVTAIGHERLACARTGETPVP